MKVCLKLGVYLGFCEVPFLEGRPFGAVCVYNKKNLDFNTYTIRDFSNFFKTYEELVSHCKFYNEPYMKNYDLENQKEKIIK